jgi:anti-anti-sigma factor
MVNASVDSRSPEKTVLRLDGLFDKDTAARFRNDFLRLARERGSRQLEINMSNVSGTDTSCIALMIEILRAVRDRGGKLKISGIDENTARMITISQLGGMFEDVIIERTSKDPYEIERSDRNQRPQ